MSLKIKVKMISKNQKLNETKEDKCEMKIWNHKKYGVNLINSKWNKSFWKVKLHSCLWVTFPGHVPGTGERNGYLHREFCVLSSVGFFSALLRTTMHALIKEWKMWELVFLVFPHAIYLCVEQLLKTTKLLFDFLANKGFLKAPEKWIVILGLRNVVSSHCTMIL